MLRALHRFLGTGVPVIGVNFGRVGFLSAMGRTRWRQGSRRAFAGEYRIVELPTLEVDVDGTAAVAINDVVCATSAIGRMVELAWAVGGEDLGVQPCDGVICATSTGSTAYNLSSGGPVLVWGLDAMAVTFVVAALAARAAAGRSRAASSSSCATRRRNAAAKRDRRRLTVRRARAGGGRRPSGSASAAGCSRCCPR